MNTSIRSRPQHLGAVRSCFEDVHVSAVRREPLTDREAGELIERFEESFKINQGSLYSRVHGTSAFKKIIGLGGWVVPHIKDHYNTTSGELRRAWQLVLSEVST